MTVEVFPTTSRMFGEVMSKEQMHDVCFDILPDLTPEGFEQMWDDYLQAKAEHIRGLNDGL